MPILRHLSYAFALGAGIGFSIIFQAQAADTEQELSNPEASTEEITRFLQEHRPALFKLNYNASVDYVDGILAPDITQFFQLDPERKSDKRVNLSGAAHMVVPLSQISLFHITGIVDWFGYEQFNEYNSLTVGGQGAWFYKFAPQTYLKISGFLSADYFTDKEFDVPTHISSSYGARANVTKNIYLDKGMFQVVLGGMISRRTFEFASLSDQDLYQGDVTFVYQPHALKQVKLFSRVRLGQVDAFNNPFLDNEFWGVETGFNWTIRPEWTLSLTASYLDGNYNDPEISPFALALQDISGKGISSELAYDVSKHLNLYGRVSYTDFESNLPRNDFEQTIISIGARSPF